MWLNSNLRSTHSVLHCRQRSLQRTRMRCWSRRSPQRPACPASSPAKTSRWGSGDQHSSVYTWQHVHACSGQGGLTARQEISRHRQFGSSPACKLSAVHLQSKTFVRLMRPAAGSSLRGAASGRAASVSQPLPHAVPEHAVPEGAPAPGSSLVSPSPCLTPRCSSKLRCQHRSAAAAAPKALGGCHQGKRSRFKFRVRRLLTVSAVVTLLHGPMQLPSPSGRMAPSIDRWEDPPGEQFLVRGADYTKSRKKVPSAAPIYRCAGCTASNERLADSSRQGCILCG